MRYDGYDLADLLSYPEYRSSYALIRQYLLREQLIPEWMTDLIVNSSVRDALEGHPVAADFYEALDDEVAELLEDAARRAEANDRQTVMPQDL